MKFRVKEFAEKQGVDAAKLARRADLNYGTVAPFFDESQEKKHNPKAETLMALAKVLGVHVGDLFISEEEAQDHLRGPGGYAYA